MASTQIRSLPRTSPQRADHSYLRRTSGKTVRLTTDTMRTCRTHACLNARSSDHPRPGAGAWADAPRFVAALFGMDPQLYSGLLAAEPQLLSFNTETGFVQSMRSTRALQQVSSGLRP